MDYPTKDLPNQRPLSLYIYIYVCVFEVLYHQATQRFFGKKKIHNVVIQFCYLLSFFTCQSSRMYVYAHIVRFCSSLIISYHKYHNHILYKFSDFFLSYIGTNVKGIEISKLNFPLCSESTCPSKDREDCFLLFSCKKIEKCYCCNINGHNKYCSSNKAHCERRCKHRA